MSENSQSETITSNSASLKLPRNAASAAARRSNVLCDRAEPRQNQILKALPKDARNRLIPCLQFKVLQRGEIIYEYGQPTHPVIFPISSIISLQCASTSGSTVEIAMVGCEGLVGVSALLGSESTVVRARVSRTGTAYGLPAQQLGNEFDNCSGVRLLLLEYVQALFNEMAQTAFCNRYHSICQQFSRWLLQSLDRLAGSKLEVTQEMIANTLGVRVAGISEVACKLQKLGVIDHHRGRITVLDRPELESMACECYAAVKSEADLLMGSRDRINTAG